MMIIDVRKLNAQKKYVGHMEFEYSAPETFIAIPYVKYAAPIKISLDYEIFEDDSVDVRGTLFYTLVGQCSRCLKETSVDVVGELDAYFENRKDYADYGYINGVVDLKQAVEDALMASMPYVVNCPEECEGISYNG